MEKFCIIDTKFKAVTERLEQYGYKCIATEKSWNVSDPVSLHADVLYLKSDDKTIYISDCQKNNISLLKAMGYSTETVNLSPGYKTESKLNMVVTDDCIICNTKTCMDISEISAKRNVINVNQGYTKCSTVVLGNKGFITEDISIYNALKAEGREVLLIEKGLVKLKGYDYGFIGGASAYSEQENTIMFFGDITGHTDYCRIIKFCNNLNINTDYIPDMELTDIGGAVMLNCQE